LGIDRLANDIVNCSRKAKEGKINEDTDLTKCKVGVFMPCRAKQILYNDSGRVGNQCNEIYIEPLISAKLLMTPLQNPLGNFCPLQSVILERPQKRLKSISQQLTSNHLENGYCPILR